MNKADRILTIEDHDSIREAITVYLEDSGFEVLQAADGRAGLECFRTDAPDLVLCDLRMPEMDGLEVLESITRESPETPVLIVSGMGEVGDAIEALKLGAWDYVTKPIQDMAVLEHAINNALERARLQQHNRLYREQLERTNSQLNQSLQQFQDDEAAGRHIQSQLLPQNHVQVGGFEFERELFPSTQLSGDFVDYFVIDDRRMGFYMADVSGHGTSSALVTLLLKSEMQRFVEMCHCDLDDVIMHPAKVLEKLNQYLIQAQLKKYLTIFYGVLSLDDNHLCYANGGQFPFPWLSHDGQIETIGKKSLPVGLFEFAEYQQYELELPQTFMMALISDGILDLLPPSELDEKLNYLSAAIRSTHADGTSLVEKLALKQDEERPDDVTLLVVRKEP